MTVRLLKIVPTLLCGGTENQAITLGRALDPSKYTLQMASVLGRDFSPTLLEAVRIQLLAQQAIKHYGHRHVLLHWSPLHRKFPM